VLRGDGRKDTLTKYDQRCGQNYYWEKGRAARSQFFNEEGF
jgi:hypothetical protein